jgi:hypothetical protein
VGKKRGVIYGTYHEKSRTKSIAVEKAVEGRI